VIGLGRRVPVHAFGERVDMRKSFDTLSAIVREHMKRDVLEGAQLSYALERMTAKASLDVRLGLHGCSPWAFTPCPGE